MAVDRNGEQRDGRGLAVRAARPDDSEGVLALAPRLLEGVAPWRDPAGALRAAQGWLTGSLDAGALLVAEADGRLLGVISVTEQGHWTGARDAYIGELAVSPEASRRGAGRALVAAVTDWARQRGLESVTLQTGAANATARAFYAALGFAEEEVRLTLPLDPA
ncbi:GNAT family N-acetyltransferase [Streptacidiphilus fuscans]|uniref:GNAT family N-acetyltransferase n=1 Tax=Streptacidiphilus fuscans TaxID=2789292 RepID=A0A931FFY9_9ACTN|nr:GNAT family N-acetyltransferase [Streptacidiphilus fuscans]MBF9072108.1 GNAT family N-acetyltransferase [Streptacidiphilus fuscans]